MEKRTFLKTGIFLGVAAAVAPFIDACKSSVKSDSKAMPVIPPPKLRRSKPFELPALGYETTALEPHIDKMTMEIHHGKHHAGYVKNLNELVKDTVYADYELDDIVARITTSDADKKIRNNAGGHWNHSFFWQIMSPKGGGMPQGALASAITGSFGSFDAFKEQFNKAATGVFGSGWAWLCVGADKKLFICGTPNQDNPMMLQVTKQTGTPVLGLDVWEHAYYLKNQNRRADYINSFYNVINWTEASMRYEKALG